MRACILIGVMASSTAWWAPAAAQLSNSPLYPANPMHQPWPNAEPTYIPAPRYPTDSRNLTLDNRAPTLWPAVPEVRDAAPRLGSAPHNGAIGGNARRPESLRSPQAAEPGRAAWR